MQLHRSAMRALYPTPAWCVQDAIDWLRLGVLWSPSRIAHPSRQPSQSPGPVASSPDSGGQQSRSARVRAVAEGPTSPRQQANQVMTHDETCCNLVYWAQRPKQNCRNKLQPCLNSTLAIVTCFCACHLGQQLALLQTPVYNTVHLLNSGSELANQSIPC